MHKLASCWQLLPNATPGDRWAAAAAQQAGLSPSCRCCCCCRLLVLSQVQPTAEGARNYSQCDSMLIGDRAAANTYPYIQVRCCTPGLCSPDAHAAATVTHAWPPRRLTTLNNNLHACLGTPLSCLASPWPSRFLCTRSWCRYGTPLRAWSTRPAPRRLGRTSSSTSSSAGWGWRTR